MTSYYKNWKNEKYPRIPWFLYETLKYYEKPFWTEDYSYKEKESESSELYFKRYRCLNPGMSLPKRKK